MEVSVIANPYDRGREREDATAGPLRYLEADADGLLSEAGYEPTVEIVERSGPFEDELSATADANARIAERVGEAVGRGAFPLVLGRNCDSALGALAGLGTAGVGVIWFDAHGDFNTPETSTSGYLAGMPVAIATGRCHEVLWREAGNDAPIRDSRVLMVGVRDLDPEEGLRLGESAISVVAADAVNSLGLEGSLRAPLDALRSQTHEVYLHLDVDVIDPRYAPGVGFPVEGGLSVEAVEEAVRAVSERFRVVAASLTAYEPDADDGDKTLRAGLRLMGAVADAAAESREEVRHGG